MAYSRTQLFGDLFNRLQEGTTITRDKLNSSIQNTITFSKKDLIEQLEVIKLRLQEGYKVKQAYALQQKELEEAIKLIEANKDFSVFNETGTFSQLGTKKAEKIKNLLGKGNEELARKIDGLLDLGHIIGVDNIKLRGDILKIREVKNLVQKELQNDSLGPTKLKNIQKDLNLLDSLEKLLRLRLLVTTEIDKVSSKSDIDNLIKQLSGSEEGTKGFKKFVEIFFKKRNIFDPENDTLYKDQIVTTYKTVTEIVSSGDKITLQLETSIDNQIKGGFIGNLSRFNSSVINALFYGYGYSVNNKKITERFMDKYLIEILNFKQSPSYIDIINKTFETSLFDGKELKYGKKSSANYGKKVHNSTLKIKSVNKEFEKVDSSLKQNLKQKKQSLLNTGQRLRNLKGQFVSTLNVMNLLNSLITKKIIENMTYPSLVNRTGRFASSVKIERAEFSREGTLGIFYSYLKYPYGIFEVGNSMGTPQRDPRILIDRSIREIASALVTAQLRTVRV